MKHRSGEVCFMKGRKGTLIKNHQEFLQSFNVPLLIFPISQE